MADGEMITQRVKTAVNGPFIMGDIAQVALWGVLLSTAGHFIASPAWSKYSCSLRGVVYLVLLLATFSTAMAITDLWYYSTLVSDSLDVILKGTLFGALEPLGVGMIAVVVQAVLVLRASKVIAEDVWRWIYITFLGCLILVEFLAGVLTEYYQLKFHFNPDDVPNFPLNYNQAIEMWMLLQGIIDVIISASRLGWKSKASESFLRLIVRMTLQSALLTSCFAWTTAIMVLIWPNFNPMTEDIYLAFMLPQPAIYALSLFTTLSISDRSHRQSREGNAYLVSIRDPNDVPLPKFETDVEGRSIEKILSR
ncbi:hypothetical protein T439DRAFT_379189 [Meredithblackwellia eburnea MCA 4105]